VFHPVYPSILISFTVKAEELPASTLNLIASISADQITAFFVADIVS
jgi:hypothetical protein